MMELLNNVLQRGERKVKQYLPSPFPSYRLVLRKDAWIAAKRSKGWRTYQDAADAMGLTRAAIQMADKTRVQVGPDFITRWAACMGNSSANWWVDFEIVPHGVVSQNHPMWNSAKEKGIVPYDSYSPAAEFRRSSYPVEKNKKDWEKDRDGKIIHEKA